MIIVKRIDLDFNRDTNLSIYVGRFGTNSDTSNAIQANLLQISRTMLPILRRKPPQASFSGAYLYDRIVPRDHRLRKINRTVDFSFVRDLLKDRYTEDFGRPLIVSNAI